MPTDCFQINFSSGLSNGFVYLQIDPLTRNQPINWKMECKFRKIAESIGNKCRCACATNQKAMMIFIHKMVFVHYQEFSLFHMVFFCLKDWRRSYSTILNYSLPIPKTTLAVPAHSIQKSLPMPFIQKTARRKLFHPFCRLINQQFIVYPKIIEHTKIYISIHMNIYYGCGTVQTSK